MSGSAVIMRVPMAEQVSPWVCAPRRILSTLYCVEVTPHARVLRCRPRCRQSAVRIRFSIASSAALEKGRPCPISSLNSATGILPPHCLLADGSGLCRLRPQRPACLLLHNFQVDRQLDFVAYHGCAIVGPDTEILPVDGGGGGISGMGLVVHPRDWS